MKPPNIEHPLWRWRVAIIGAVTLLSSLSAVSLSAVISVLLARTANKRGRADVA